MRQDAHGRPILIRDKKTQALHRVEFGDAFRDEAWLQSILFQHPELIPFDEIEPAFGQAVCLSREVESGSGPIDLVYANQDGLLTLVETKLWRNPESRRVVVSQLIDYAASVAKMTYEQLKEAVAKASGETGDVLVKRLQAASASFNAGRFHDAISRNLKRGRFLLLIAGDGIREDVDSMTEFLQGQPHLGFTLALVELALFRVEEGKDDPLLVQPRVLARTREVTRAVVEVKVQGIQGVVETTVRVPSDADPEAEAAKGNITAQEFLQTLRAQNPIAADAVEWIVAEAPKHGLKLKWGKRSFSILFEDPSGCSFQLANVSDAGDVSFWVVYRHCAKQGLPEQMCLDFFTDIAALVPGSKVTRYEPESPEKPHEQVLEMGGEGSPVPVGLLAPRKEEWLAAMDRFSSRIRQAMESKERGM